MYVVKCEIILVRLVKVVNNYLVLVIKIYYQKYMFYNVIKEKQK